MNKIRRSIGLLAASMLLFAASAAPTLAVTNAGAGAPTPYVAAFAPVFGIDGFPRTGTMELTVQNGTVSGTYSGTSVGPDYLDNRLVPVTGTVNENDGYVQLYIGGAITLRGTMANDGTITGTAQEGGRLYEFGAAPKMQSKGGTAG